MPFIVSLDAATTVQVGEALDLGGFATEYTTALIREYTYPTDRRGSVALEGSQDGVNWFTIGGVTDGFYSPTTRHVVRYVRANLLDVQNESITVWIASPDIPSFPTAFSGTLS